ARARWDGAGASFHALFQIQLMGLYGAFLTADLFNLFVFFEVLLAASYGLLLHGSGRARVRAGLHYIAINLFASVPEQPFDGDASRMLDLLARYHAQLGLPAPVAPGPQPDPLPGQIEAVLRLRPAVFSFTFGRMPADALARCRELG
ncbi:hypothetical protein SB762_31150, partial [Pseudomonas sp. SIMBA_021]